MEPGLVAAWLAGRSLARGLPPPLADRGGLRIDTGTPDEIARWVFAAPGPAITQLTGEITRSDYAVRLAGGHAELTPLLARGWRVVSENQMMVAGKRRRSATLPEGYRWLERRAGAVTHLRVLTDDGLLAASGYAAAHDGAFVYDRILTVAGHRRRGLGAALMTALGAYRPAGAIEVLTATPVGRALYEALGWRPVSAWTAATFTG